MENEINKLKIEYQSIVPPQFLVTNGAEDMWNRVDSERRFLSMYSARFVMLGILIFIVLSGFIGVISVQAKPGSVLYPIKTLTKKAVTAFSNTTVVKFYNSSVNQIKNPEEKLQITPQASPTPTVTNENKQENEKPEDAGKNNDKNENNSNSESNQNQDSNREDVKGVNVSEDNKNSDNKSSENSHGENDNSKKGDSQNNLNKNNDNAQNQNKENED